MNQPLKPSQLETQKRLLEQNKQMADKLLRAMLFGLSSQVEQTTKVIKEVKNG